jgi:hypothetical protein
MPTARRRVAKHVPLDANMRISGTLISKQRPQFADNSRIISVALQRAVNTIEEEVFSVWFACMHCWTTDVFSMCPPRDYISGTESNQIRMKKMRTRIERVLGNRSILIKRDYKKKYQ